MVSTIYIAYYIISILFIFVNQESTEINNRNQLRAEDVLEEKHYKFKPTRSSIRILRKICFLLLFVLLLLLVFCFCFCFCFCFWFFFFGFFFVCFCFCFFFFFFFCFVLFCFVLFFFFDFSIELNKLNISFECVIKISFGVTYLTSGFCCVFAVCYIFDIGFLLCFCCVLHIWHRVFAVQ